MQTQDLPQQEVVGRFCPYFYNLKLSSYPASLQQGLPPEKFQKLIDIGQIGMMAGKRLAVIFRT